MYKLFQLFRLLKSRTSMLLSILSTVYKQLLSLALMTYFLLHPCSDASGGISVYSTKDMWSNASQTTSASGLSDWNAKCLVVLFHLYLTLFSCGQTT